MTSSEFFDEERAETIPAEQSGYVVGEKIYTSEEGFSELYLLRREGRLLIGKALREEYRGNEIAEAALRKEFQIGFQIDLPGAVRTFDFTTLPEIGKTIVLEYCRGSNLRVFIDSGEGIAGEALNHIADQLTTALRGIHAEGVIHRDIKPENIIYDRVSGKVKIIDFGCADAFDQSMLKGRAGTELYHSERFSNTPSGDWYALSLTLSELSGRCSERKAVGRIRDLCNVMRQGKDPGISKPKKYYLRPIFRIITLILLLIAGMGGLTYYLYLPKEKKTEEKKIPVKEAKDDPITKSDDALILPEINENTGHTEDTNRPTKSSSNVKEHKAHPNGGNEGEKLPETTIPNSSSGKSKKEEGPQRQSTGSQNKRSLVEYVTYDGGRVRSSVMMLDMDEACKYLGVSEIKMTDGRRITEEELYTVQGRLHQAAADLLRIREEKFQRELQTNNRRDGGLFERDLKAEYFSENECVYQILSRVKGIPEDIPQNLLKRLATRTYNEVFGHHFPIF